MRPAAKRELVGYAHQKYGMAKRQACKLFGIQESVYYYHPQGGDEDPRIRAELSELAELHRRWGFWMMHHRLRGLGFAWNHKRVYRVYREMGLSLRRKYKKRLPDRIKEPLVQPLFPNMHWSMDFMEDALSDGTKFRSFNLIDDFNREALQITLDRSINSHRVIRELNRLKEWRGLPEKIRVDNGPEFIAQRLKDWCDDQEKPVELVFIQKGKPSQNAYIERFNRTYRTEVLDAHSFEDLNQARILTHCWMWMYNNQRPHSSLGYKTPVDFALKCGYRKAMPTFQHDIEHDYKSLFLNTTNTG